MFSAPFLEGLQSPFVELLEPHFSWNQRHDVFSFDISRTTFTMIQGSCIATWRCFRPRAGYQSRLSCLSFHFTRRISSRCGFGEPSRCLVGWCTPGFSVQAILTSRSRGCYLVPRRISASLKVQHSSSHQQVPSKNDKVEIQLTAQKGFVPTMFGEEVATSQITLNGLPNWAELDSEICSKTIAEAARSLSWNVFSYSRLWTW